MFRKLFALLTALMIYIVFLTGCLDSQMGEASSSQTIISEHITEIEYVHGILQSYLEDMWGYRFGVHHELVFEKTTEIENIEVFVFSTYSIEGEFSNTFAISVSEEKVFILNEEWVECVDPEPWGGW